MSFECLPNCGFCCMSVVIPIETFEANKDKEQVEIIELKELSNKDVFPITEDKFCIYLERKSKKCMIYDKRPKICREYGLSDSLPCPFIKKNGHVRSDAQQKMILRRGRFWKSKNERVTRR